MKKQTIQEIAVQKSLQLPEDAALKVLVFIAGLEAGRNLNTLNTPQNKELGQCGKTA